METLEGSERGDANARWAAADDAALLAAIARGVEPAIGEFYRRFIDLLIAIARRQGVPAGERRSRAAEFLDDTALRFADTRQRAPRSLVAYLATSFRRRLGMDWRAETRERRRHGATLSEVADGSQLVVAEMCSEFAIRSATSPEGGGIVEQRGLSEQVRAELARVLWTSMSEEEQLMMGYLAERYPQRDIADRLGIAPTAARVRIMRLRQRLRRIATQYVATLSVQDGIMLARVLGAPRGQPGEHPRRPAAEEKRLERRNQKRQREHQRPRYEDGRQPGGPDHE